jgi:hypothetical protein
MALHLNGNDSGKGSAMNSAKLTKPLLQRSKSFLSTLIHTCRRPQAFEDRFTGLLGVTASSSIISFFRKGGEFFSCCPHAL